jgi:hypothetical protein
MKHKTLSENNELSLCRLFYLGNDEIFFKEFNQSEKTY